MVTNYQRRLWQRLSRGNLQALLGIERAPVRHRERLISAAGGFVGIMLVVLMQRDVIGETGAAMIVASMGASAVLLFAVPHGALSQPWAVLIGHGVSAVIGVTCARYVPDPMAAAALAVGLSIGAMHYLRAIHPPGGATALTAVIGGPQLASLGYGYVLSPVLANALVITLAAVAVNAAFAWRRYPAAWGLRQLREAPSPVVETAELTHADFMAALARVGTFVDISEADFLRLTQLMKEEKVRRRVAPEQLRLGASYANDASGAEAEVRRIVDMDKTRAGGDVIWRVIAGRNRNETGHATREAFASWAAFEVVRGESTWVRREAGAKD